MHNLNVEKMYKKRMLPNIDLCVKNKTKYFEMAKVSF